jgi:hypothetical protein
MPLKGMELLVKGNCRMEWKKWDGQAEKDQRASNKDVPD